MLSILLLLSAQSVANDSDLPVADIDGWSIYRNPAAQRCQAITLFENGEGIVVAYDAATKDTQVAFTEKNATSLKEEDERTIDIYLQKRNGKVDDGWEGVKFTAHVNDQGQRMLTSQDLLQPFLEDFAKSKGLAFFFAGKKIAAYNLGKSAEVAKALRKCAMKEAGINPLDPFAN